MITKIQFKNQNIPILKNTFDLKRINVLIGLNGCGKSTFINNIVNKKVKALNKDDDKPIDFLYKDFASDMRTEDNSNNQDKFMIGIASHFLSRGELTFNTYIEGLSTLRNKLILMDEPDRGLDINNLKTLIKLIKTNKSCQFIISTHNPYLMRKFNNYVIELTPKYYGLIMKENLR